MESEDIAVGVGAVVGGCDEVFEGGAGVVFASFLKRTWVSSSVRGRILTKYATLTQIL